MPRLAYRTSLPKPDDPDIIRRIAEATRKGHPLTTAARLAGIGEMTANDWRRIGRDIIAQNPETPPEELGPHALFSWALQAAEADLVDSRLGVIEEAGNKGQWVAAMTLLERRFPNEFGRYQRIEQRTVSVNLQATLPAGAERALLGMVAERLEAGNE